ncbi:hypothetical protein BV898_16529 [Hypsibius exemplaris]|uniref:Uncharacterized protein n=1 Tax=Hypsibius exemplaris TaxID=2072580 RepID=A0A9X6NG08_HYPEX|nr:hypothetical protein BV898_16529 [Hypsibius exemplaris]
MKYLRQEWRNQPIAIAFLFRHPWLRGTARAVLVIGLPFNQGSMTQQGAAVGDRNNSPLRKRKGNQLSDVGMFNEEEDEWNDSLTGCPEEGNRVMKNQRTGRRDEE